MSPAVKELYEAAMALPEADRAELAELLSAEAGNRPGGLHPAWRAELDRRWAEIESGQVRSIPWDVLRAGMRQGFEGEESSGG